MDRHFQLYQNPRTGTWLGSNGRRQIVSVLGVLVEDVGAIKPRIRYLISGGDTADHPGHDPRFADAASVDMSVLAHPQVVLGE